jgi:hypothetical protein
MSDTRARPSSKQAEVSKQYEKPDLTKSRDVLLITFYLIQSTSLNTLNALALVNRDFYQLATYVRHKSLVLDLAPSNVQAAHDRQRYAEKHKLLQAIQTLHVKDPGEAPYYSFGSDGALNSTLSQCQELVALVDTLLPSMTGLRDLTWHPHPSYTDIAPGSVFLALRSCPKVRLHSMVGWPPGVPSHKPHKERVVRYRASANLYELHADFTFGRSKYCIEFTQPLKHLLLSSPAIRSLRLDIKQPRGGCVVSAPPTEYCGLGFVGNESLPPLEELVLLNYPWGRESAASTNHPRPNSIGYPGKGLEMDHWATNFDWSSLKCLTTTYVNFALKIMPRLTSLTEVDFKTHHPKSDIIRFYQECPTALESIGADRLECVTLDGILRHGSALKKLRLHTVEGSKWAETAMDGVSLRAIRNNCPLIEELFLDVPRHNDWPWDMLDILASFPRLTDLTICFELGLNNNGNPVKPYVTFDSVNTLYRYLRSHAPEGQTCRISRLHVYSGAPPPLGFGYPGPGAFWPGQNSTEFVCTLSERDDEAARDCFDVVCPKAVDAREESTGDWELARDGPRPRGEWRALW